MISCDFELNMMSQQLEMSLKAREQQRSPAVMHLKLMVCVGRIILFHTVLMKTGPSDCVDQKLISNDGDDLGALTILQEVLREAHDALGIGHHPGERKMEQYIECFYHLPGRQDWIRWYRACCDGCQEKVCSQNLVVLYYCK